MVILEQDFHEALLLCNKNVIEQWEKNQHRTETRKVLMHRGNSEDTETRPESNGFCTASVD